MSKIYILNPSKEVYNLINWLDKNCYRSKYDVTYNILGFNKKGKFLRATNSFVLAMCNLDDDFYIDEYDRTLPDGIYKVVSINKKVIELETLEGDFPNMNFLFEKHDEVTDILCLTPKILIDLIEPFDSFAIKIGDKHFAQQVVLDSNGIDLPLGEYYGFIMPRVFEVDTTANKFTNRFSSAEKL